MRLHLIQCFEHQKLTAFPKARQIGDFRRPELQHITITVFCPCQRPDSFDKMTNVIHGIIIDVPKLKRIL